MKQEQELKQNQNFIGMLLGALKNMDINQVQHYIKNANQAIGTIQRCARMFKEQTEQSSRNLSKA